jgi:hypothetical protein
MTKKRILGCFRVPPVEYHCSKPVFLKLLAILNHFIGGQRSVIFIH